MIQAINAYIVERFQRIKMPVPVTDPPTVPDPIVVYPPAASRPKGVTVRPSIAVSLLNDPTDVELARPAHEVFVPSEATVTTQASEQFGRMHKAVVTATQQEPYQIEQGTTDTLAFRVGAEFAWGDDQAVTFMPGSRDAWEIARSCNILAKGVVASSENGKLRLEAATPGDDIEILADDRSAHEVIGLAPGVTSHLTIVGPASWTVKPYPTPVELYYQADLRTADEAQARILPAFLLDCLPHGHRPAINGQFPLFRQEKPQNLDELAKPEFWTAFRWVVRFAWLSRLTGYQVKPIQDFRPDLRV